MITTGIISTTTANTDKPRINEEDFWGLSHDLFGNDGVVSDTDFLVSIVSGMDISVSPGVGYIEVTRQNTTYKLRIKNDTDTPFTISGNSSGVTRIDRLILRVDASVEPNSLKTNMAFLEIVQLLPTDPYIELAQITVDNGAVTISGINRTVSKLKTYDDDDINTLVQNSLNNGDISVPDNLYSLWDKSTIMQHLMRGFSFLNPYQYIYGTTLYDLVQKNSWTLPSLRTAGGGGFTSNTELVYSTNTEIRLATLGADEAISTQILSGVNPSGCSIFPKNGYIYVNNNAGQTTPSATTTSTTLTASYNYSAKTITYTRTGGNVINFTTFFNVGESVQISGNANSVNNRTRTVVSVGVSSITFSAPDITQNVPISLTLNSTNADGETLASVLGNSFVQWDSLTEGSSYNSYATYTASGLMSGDNVNVNANYDGNISLASSSYISVPNATGTTSVSGSITATGSTQSFGVSGGYSYPGSTFLSQISGSVSANRSINGGQNESSNNNIEMVGGSSQERIIKAFEIVGTALVNVPSEDITLDLSLKGYCDEFSINDDNDVLMGKTDRASAVQRANGSVEIIDAPLTPIYSYMAYVQSTNKTYYATKISLAYNVTPFPL